MKLQSFHAIKRAFHLLMITITLVVCAGSTSAQSSAAASLPRFGSENGGATTKRHLTTVRTSESVNGLRIAIGALEPITDAVGYRSADRFVVVIPQAELSALQIDVRGLNSFQLDPHNADVSLSFRVDSATDVRLGHENGLVVVTLNRQTETAARPVNATYQSFLSDDGARNVTSADSGSFSPPATSAPAASVPAATLQTSALDSMLQAVQKLFKTDSVDVANLDLATPESPAFAVLGLTPQTVVRPASPREFASSLINGLDKNGNFQSGLAIDTAPYLLFNGRNVTLEDYNKDRLTRFLTRTQFSFAAAKGSSADDPTTKLSLGLNLTLFDAGDPRIYRKGQDGDVLTCFEERLSINVPPVPPQLPGETDAQREQKLQAFRDAVLKQGKMKEIAEQCREEGRKTHWNKHSWTVAFAPSWISKTGSSSDFKWNGGALWTSYAHGIGDTGQFILHARLRNKEQVPDPAKSGSFIIQSSAFFGGRFRVGNPDFGLNLEGLFVRNRPQNKPAKNTYEFSVAAERKLSDNVYFVISAGSKGPQADNTKSHGFVITSFKYGFSKKPQIATGSN